MVDRVRALIIVDVQNDFCEGGSLAVAGGTALAPAITGYLAGERGYQHVVATEDFHIDPGDHFSDQPDFSSSWPPHCIAGSTGADLHPELDTTRIETVFRKGAYAAAYSGFEGVDEDGTPLLDWLRQRGVDQVDIVGIATDQCVRRTAEDAEDALQDAMLSAHRGAGSFRHDAAVSSWLHRIVINACLDRLRRAKAQPTVPLEDVYPVADRTAHVDDAIVVQRALMRLPVEQRAAVVAVDMQGYSIADTATMLGVAEGTIKSRCSRGRVRLGELLGYLNARAPKAPDRAAGQQ